MKKSKDQSNNVIFKIIENWRNPSKIPQKDPYGASDEQLNKESEQLISGKPKMFINRDESASIIKKGHPIKKI